LDVHAMIIISTFHEINIFPISNVHRLQRVSDTTYISRILVVKETERWMTYARQALQN